MKRYLFGEELRIVMIEDNRYWNAQLIAAVLMFKM